MFNPYFWVGILLLVVGAFGSGFLKGKDWEQGQQAVKELNKKEAVVVLRKKITVGQDKIAAAFEQGRTSREDEFRELRAELDKHLGLLNAMPASCDLPPDVIRLLNGPRAARGPAADPSKPASGVPPASGSPGRPPGDGGQSPASGLGRLTGLPGTPQGAGGSGEVPGPAAQLTQGVTP